MSKNLFPEIAKLLGVEINEEFTLCVADQPLIKCKDEFCITNNNIVMRKENGDTWKPLGTDAAYKLLNGTLDVVRKPWKPKYREEYRTYNNAWCVVVRAFMNCPDDYMALKCGCVFRTDKEAIEARPRIYKELTGSDWND